jgi:hypothetical protein
VISEKVTSISATVTTVIGAILAQFAPWLQTSAKATIASAAAFVLAWFTHEHHATVRAKLSLARPVVPMAPPNTPVPVTVVAGAPPVAHSAVPS